MLQAVGNPGCLLDNLLQAASNRQLAVVSKQHVVGLTPCWLSVGFLHVEFPAKVVKKLFLMFRFFRSKDVKVVKKLFLMFRFFRSKDSSGEWSPCILLCLTKACFVDLWADGLGGEVLLWDPFGAVLLWVPFGRGGEGSAVIPRQLEGAVGVGWSWTDGLSGKVLFWVPSGAMLLRITFGRGGEGSAVIPRWLESGVV